MVSVGDARLLRKVGYSKGVTGVCSLQWEWWVAGNRALYRHRSGSELLSLFSLVFRVVFYIITAASNTFLLIGHDPYSYFTNSLIIETNLMWESPLCAAITISE